MGQELKIETYGSNKNKALIFLHGGPGYNSVVFERTTATELSKNGFFVISYDRRGEGRNEQLNPNYTFEQTFDDLNTIYKTFKLKKATLMGHSFGGVVATLFAEKHPNKVENIVLLSVPISMQKTLKNIISKSKKIYEEKSDKVNLNYINILEQMDKSSLEYCSYCLMHAMSNKFYSTKHPNEKAISLYGKFRTDNLMREYASKMNYLATQKFWENEKYTTISIEDNLKNLKKRKVKIYAIYGEEDGLYSKEQVKELRNILGEEKLKYLENCSHNIFIDQQEVFIDLVKKWIK